jgi:SAM-dependent methyltransferase
MNEYISSVICCPACHGELLFQPEQIACVFCGATYRIQSQVPVFFQDVAAVAPIEHQSNPIAGYYEDLLRTGNDLILHIGAGATSSKYAKCIEFEHKIFKHTDVVGDAHALPFRENVFDRVFAFNVFEHLRNPHKAAAEVLRVLKPNGLVAIHTAFLQPLHESPAHFFNATEFGVRDWFSAFQIEKCDVSDNFGPGVMLAFLMSSVVQSLREAGITATDQTRILDTRLRDWATFWDDRLVGPPDGFDVLQNLPQSLQKRISAGFELLARKPAAAA